MIQTRQMVNAKHQTQRRCVDAAITRALSGPSKEQLRAELAEAARNTAHDADQKRLAEIDAQLRAAGYWGARLSALNEERMQIVARLLAHQKAGV